MRYYNFTLNANAEQIKEKTPINIFLYENNTFFAMNSYMYENLDNDMYFFVYREDENAAFAVFSYDEKKKMFDDVFAYITGVLKEIFFVNKIKTDPYEITMYQARDFLLEARRREFVGGSCSRLAETMRLWCFFDQTPQHFAHREKIVPEGSGYKKAIYDQTFIDELSNIEEHENFRLKRCKIVRRFPCI